MDIQLFEQYFGVKTLKISGRLFPVTMIYKDYSKMHIGHKDHMIKKIEMVINQ